MDTMLLRTLARGEVLCKQGVLGLSLFLVESGVLEESKDGVRVLEHTVHSLPVF
eukprot:SAG31_NODE_5612_length_2424_cov_1.301075_3_plen_54_part_00